MNIYIYIYIYIERRVRNNGESTGETHRHFVLLTLGKLKGLEACPGVNKHVVTQNVSELIIRVSSCLVHFYLISAVGFGTNGDGSHGPKM